MCRVLVSCADFEAILEALLGGFSHPLSLNFRNLVPRVFHLTAWNERGKTLAHAGHVSPRILQITIKLLKGWAA